MNQQIVCHRKGIVSAAYCATTCPNWRNAKEGNLWGNSEKTCEHFGHIIRTEAEQAQMGVRLLQPGKPGFDRASKQMAENEERDLEKEKTKRFAISVPTTFNPNVPIQIRKVLSEGP